jgi:Ca2+-binding EF-hand superfamily protein
VIEITDFVNKFMAELERRTKQTSLVKIQVISKLNSLLHSVNISIFDFFVKMDTNKSGKVSKVELMTGLANFGLVLTQEETKMLWSMLHKPSKKLNTAQSTSARRDPLKPKEPEISYFDIMTCFIQNGIVKFSKTTDSSDILIGKYRQQMKRLNLTVDKLFKTYDPKDVRFVFKHDFVDTSLLLGFEFSDEELVKIFEHFCKQGDKEESA